MSLLLDIGKPVALRTPDPYIPLTYNTGGIGGLTANASANTKATSYTAIDGSVDIDSDGFFLSFRMDTASRDFLIDVAIGAASSEVNIIDNILVSSSGFSFNDIWTAYFPIALTAGTRLSARCQASTGSSATEVSVVHARGGIFRKMRKRRATTYGANTADSGGVTIDCGASANNYGAWAELSSAVTNPVRSALVCLGNRLNGARTTATTTFDVGFGASLSEAGIVEGLRTNMEANSDYVRQCFFFPIDLNLAAGKRLVMRAKSSTADATDRLFDGVIIGFD